MDKVEVQAWLQEEVEYIVRLYAAGKREQAIKAFTAVVARGRFKNLAQEEKEASFLKPLEVFAAKWGDKEGLVMAGQILAWRKDYLGAKEKFELAMALDPDYAIAYNYRGNAYADLGDNQKALLDYDQAIVLDPEYAVPYNNRGIAYYNLGEKQKALLDYDKASALNLEFASAYINRGNAHSALGENKRALLDYDKAIAIDPENASAYYNRGITYYKLGDKQKALPDYDKTIALDPEFASAYNNRGLAYSDLGDKGKALLDYNKAIALDSGFALAFFNRGNAYSDLGDDQKALLDYDKAIAFNPEDANAYYNRSLVYEKEDKIKEAIQDLEKFQVLATDPFWIERARGRLVNLEAKLQDKFVREISGWVDKIREVLRFEGDQVSHFTQLTGARFMLLEGSPFRLSEATFMNDPSEGKALFDLHKLPKAFNVNAARSDGEYIKKPFFGCFVKAEMKDDLAMWRLYGHDAAGISLTFDRRKLLSALMQNEKLKNAGSEARAGRPIFEFFQIAYFNEKGKVVLPEQSPEREIELQGYLDALKKSLEDAEQDEKSKPFLPLIQEEVASIMYLFKSAQYQYEKEIRLMVNEDGFDVTIKGNENTPPRVYLEIAPIHQAVSCITLGPKVPKSEEWVSAFFYFYDKEKLKVKLHVSQLPYK